METALILAVFFLLFVLAIVLGIWGVEAVTYWRYQKERRP